MSTVVILLDGVDITSQVIFSDAEFTQQANGQPGACRFQVRDEPHTFAPHAGQTLTVDVDDVRVWGGWVLRVSPGYFFAVDDTTDPQATERVWTLEGVDYNILFSKRFLINKAHPTKMIPNYPAGTPDNQIVLDLVDRFLELGSDRISTTGVTHVGSPNPDDTGNVGNPGDPWGASMSLIARPTQAVFYIDPMRILRYVDVETVTAPFALSDQPDGGGGGGGNSVIETFDQIVGLGITWGTGQLGTWAEVPGGGSSVEVSGGQGIMHAGWEFVGRPDVSTDVFRIATHFKWTSGGGTFAGLSMGTSIGLTHDIESFVDDTGFVNLIDTDGGGNSGSTNPPTPDAFHTMAMELDAGAGLMHFKMWVDGDPDPGWQVEAASTIQISDLVQIGVYAYPSGGPFLFDDFQASGDGTGGGGGGDAAGYREMEITNNGTSLINDMMVWGAGAHSTPDIRFKRVEDDDSIATHGRWQAGEFTTSLFTNAGVNQRAQSFVYGSPQSKRGGKDDSIQVSCKLFRPGLTAGQIVHFVSNVFGYQDDLPIRRLGIRFPTPTDVEFTVYLSYDIDAPWSDYEFWFPKINFRIPRIDIDLPPIPGLPPTVEEPCDCIGTIPFDDFERVVDTSGMDWGVATPGGQSWTPDPFSGGANFFVGNGNGVAYTSLANVAGMSVTPPPFGTATDFVMTTRIAIYLQTDLSPADEGIFFIVYDADVDGFWSCRIYPYLASLGSPFTGIGLDYDGGSIVNSAQPITHSARVEGGQVWYFLKWEKVGSTHRVKIWLDGDAEPDWQLSQSGLPEFVPDSFRVEMHGQTDSEYDIDSIDFDGDRCAEPQLDDFNRPGNTVGDGWGTATPSGFAWATTGQAYLAGTYGNLFPANSGVTPVHSVATISDPGPWDGEMTLLMKFGFPEIGPASSPESGYLAEIADSAGLYSAVVSFSPSVTNGEVTLYSGSGGVVVGTTAAQFARSWTAGIAYMMRWEHGRPTTGIDRIRIWEADAPEPSTWDLELGSTGAPAFSGSLTGPFLTFDDFTLAPNRPQAWFIESIDIDYADRPCYFIPCAPSVADDFGNADTTAYDCVTQAVDWEAADATINAQVSQGARISSSGGLLIEFRANSSDGNYSAFFGYDHDYSDDDRCDFVVQAAVGGSLTALPDPPAPPSATVVGGTSPTTSGVELTMTAPSPTSCEDWTVTAKVSFSKVMSSYDALMPPPSGFNGAYDLSGSENTTQTFFPRAFIEFMNTFGISLRSDGSGDVAYIGNTPVDFPISAGVTYAIEFQATGNIGALRVWVDGDPTPVDPTISVTFDTSPEFGVFVQQLQFSDDDFSVTVSDLSVSGSAVPVPNVSGDPSVAGSRCDEFAGGGVEFTVAGPYQEQSTRAYIDGVFQRRDLDYSETDPDGGVVVFGEATPVGSTVTICYTAFVGVG